MTARPLRNPGRLDGGAGMITFVVPGLPVSKNDVGLGLKGRKAYIYRPSRIKNYEQEVGWYAKIAMKGKSMIEGPVAVLVKIYLYGWHDIDVDNASKTILDAMKKIVYVDDRQVVDLRVRKLREKNQKRERVEIEIREFKEAG